MAEREEDTWQVEGLSVESDSEEEPEERPEEEADAAEEAQLPRQEEMDLAPSKVFFTHDHISSKFRSGTLIDDAVRDIINGGKAFDDFPSILCTRFHDKLFSINNRRLFVARVLEQMGCLHLIHIVVVALDDPYLQREGDGGLTKWERSFSITNGGLFVRVRSDFREFQSKHRPCRTSLSRPDWPDAQGGKSQGSSPLAEDRRGEKG
ncbi:eri-1 [Symbiodinium microadriaticum]|nr:eri-1 [Symbiodinium sp. KB8]CAE7742687.1 eri-1 [Symbiodinium microadriaticum]